MAEAIDDIIEKYEGIEEEDALSKLQAALYTEKTGALNLASGGTLPNKMGQGDLKSWLKKVVRLFRHGAFD